MERIAEAVEEVATAPSDEIEQDDLALYSEDGQELLGAEDPFSLVEDATDYIWIQRIPKGKKN